MDTGVELLQFHHSHYNEKARWALDWKGIPHRRTTLLPGPHMVPIRRLTGATRVPVLRIDGETISDSARIIAELERRQPEPALFPADRALRARALDLQARFDIEVGPLVRRAFFSILLGHLGYVARIFARDRAAPRRAFYRASLPLVRPLMARSIGLAGAASVREAFDGTRAGLDFVAKHAGPSGQLVGDAFSGADLTAASLLAPACNPAHPAMALPEPMPEAVRAWIRQWADHPGTAWVHEQYRRYRPPSAEVS